ncbi:hypothetical protein FJT64_010798 [Amphibalanus amphitrite]|uniref:Uncharacterized protein n=1 Tax=Amphibalanus amphitrite TaxID=1232801 RepID=A0A6A4VD06_AMPAM|nr:hypothetical protein FJT64_010798 [Amphibalanus amphitrite]
MSSSTADQLLERARLGSQLLRVISDVEYSDPHLPKPAPPDRESAFSFLLRTVAVVVFGSLAALVGLIFFTMAMTRLCVEGPCCDDEDSQTAAGEDRQPAATLTTTSSPPSAPSPPARSRELQPVAVVAPAGHSPRRDSPPPYPGRRQERAQEEEPPPSYREVCEVIHC